MFSLIERLICRRCRWYSASDGKHRKCYYEPRCVVGWIALIFSALAIAIKLRSKAFYKGREQV